MVNYIVYNKEYYIKCINNYDISKNYNTQVFNNNIDICIDNNIIENIDNYNIYINNIINNLHNCKSKPFIQNKSSIYDINNNTNINKNIKNLMKIIIPYFEKQIYNSYLDIIDIKLLKHFKGNHSNEGAFNWHIDNHPDYIINIIIYLNDVDNENSGGFQYITNKNNNKCVKYEYNNRPGGIIMNNLLNDDKYLKNTVLGNKGKIFYFNNNIVHRASNVLNKDRFAIILQVAPNMFKIY
tara:strand:+ start:3827 stop:4543 length:717 start_codon:yes stop_codon:yes gene_type:complete